MAKFRQKGLPERDEEGFAPVRQSLNVEKYYEAGRMRSPGFVPGKQGLNIDFETGKAEFRRVNIGSEIINLSAGQSVKEAVELLNAIDGGIINLGVGTFVMPALSVEIKKPILINGISPAQTIIDFNDTAGKFVAKGTNVYTTGTITSITGGINVTGSGTSWLANVTPLVSQFFLNGVWHSIAAVTSNTALVLAEGYVGSTVGAGTAYRIATPITDIRIQNLAIKNSTGSAIDLDDVRFITFSNLLLQDNNIGIDATYFSEFIRERITIVSSTSHGAKYSNGGRSSSIYENSISSGGHGFLIEDCDLVSWAYSDAVANTTDGYHLKDCNDVQLSPVGARNNGGQGIEMESGCDNISILDPIIEGNSSDGIKFTATIDNSRVVAGQIEGNGGYGINIAASTCDDNLILASNFNGNTSGEVNDSGTGTIRIQESDQPVQNYGDGSDGDVTISADTSLSRDMFYVNLTVNSTKTLTTNGFRVFVKTLLTNNGTISASGGNGGNGGNGGAGSGSQGSGGSAGVIAHNSGSLPASLVGKAGGSGGDENTAGSNGTAGTGQTKSIGVAGVAGGNGGAGGGGTYAGGSGQSGGALSGTAFNYPRSSLSAYTLFDSQPSNTFAVLQLSASSGSAGGGGAGGGGNHGTGGGGGGSGAPGGIIWIFAKTIINAGTITANGGNGGNGGNAVGGPTNGGGGGGGGGGVIILSYLSLTDTGTIAVAGGTAGAKGLGGTGAGGGVAGSDGVDGTAGNTGIKIDITS